MDHKKREISNRFLRMETVPEVEIPFRTSLMRKQISRLPFVNILEGKIRTNRFDVKQQTRITTAINILLVQQDTPIATF